MSAQPPCRPGSTRAYSTGHRAVWLTLVAGLMALPAALGAQATSTAILLGSASDEFGDPLPNALVSLFRSGNRVGDEVTTGRTGRFALEGLAPGRYDLRVEALGFHPVVVEGVALRPRSTVDVPVRLRVGRPPITVIDTVPAANGALEVQRWIESLELNAPAESWDIREALELVTTMDPDMGSLGLPSGFTTFTVQGVPFRGAALAPRIQDRGIAVTGGSVGLVRVAPLGRPEAFGLNAGGEVEVFNPNPARGETEVFAAGSAGALWKGRYDTPDDLSPSSIWVQGRTAVDLVPDSLRVVAGADFHHIERPRLPLFTGGPLAEPEVQSSEQVSAYLLTDWNLGGGTRVDLGARFGARPAADSRVSLAYPGGVSGHEARDVLVGAGVVSALGPRGSLGVRIGFTSSLRSGSTGAWPVDGGTPFLEELTTGLQGGISPLAVRESLRQGIFGSATFGVTAGNHLLETGFEILRSNHEIQPLSGSTLWSGAGDPFAAGWTGLAERFEGAVGTQDFGVTDFSAFVRDSWRPLPNLHLQLGARWHQEQLPTDDLSFSSDWAQLSGLEPVEPTERVNAFGGHLGMDWVAGGGDFRLSAVVGATVDETDPWLIAEALALGGSAQRRLVQLDGSESQAWPAFPGGIGTSLVTPPLVLLPESRALPASLHGSASLSTRLAGIVLGVTGTFRRTENLTRRVDINRIAVPSGTTERGGEVWGTPTKFGTLVTSELASSRRFGSFDHVWSILQDGWSQYLGVTFSLERRGASGVQLAGWYTLSTTTDNLPGLARGRPELSGTSEMSVEDDWSEGTSDLDVPHRIGAAIGIPLPILAGGVIRGRAHVQSGRTFTPGVRNGVDLNADGIAGNDPVWIPSGGLEGLSSDWDCALDRPGAYIERNACRLPWVPYLDLGLSLGLVEFGGGTLSLEVDGFNLLEAFDTRTDEALFLVETSGLQVDGSTLSPTLRVNPDLGRELYDTREGRMLRLGIRWGGGR